MTRKSATDHPVHDFIANRWSPCGFSDKPVSNDDLRSIFEAARWAPSSYNEQPWTYIVGTKDDSGGYDKVFSCLVDGNQSWAKLAPVLAISVTKERFALDGKPNKAAEHDIGLASATLTFEATARGLYVHQMIGILPDKAREVFAIPEGFHALTGLAIGYLGDIAAASEEIKKRDTAERTRKPIHEFIFSGAWEQNPPWVK